jgi:hypothetical protein
MCTGHCLRTQGVADVMRAAQKIEFLPAPLREGGYVPAFGKTRPLSIFENGYGRGNGYSCLQSMTMSFFSLSLQPDLSQLWLR